MFDRDGRYSWYQNCPSSTIYSPWLVILQYYANKLITQFFSNQVNVKYIIKNVYFLRLRIKNKKAEGRSIPHKYVPGSVYSLILKLTTQHMEYWTQKLLLCCSFVQRRDNTSCGCGVLLREQNDLSFPRFGFRGVSTMEYQTLTWRTILHRHTDVRDHIGLPEDHVNDKRWAKYIFYMLCKRKLQIILSVHIILMTQHRLYLYIWHFIVFSFWCSTDTSSLRNASYC